MQWLLKSGAKHWANEQAASVVDYERCLYLNRLVGHRINPISLNRPLVSRQVILSGLAMSPLADEVECCAAGCVPFESMRGWVR